MKPYFTVERLNGILGVVVGRMGLDDCHYRYAYGVHIYFGFFYVSFGMKK